VKVVEKLPDFPAKRPTLRGLNAEAYQLLQGVDKAKPVLKVNPEGQNVAAVKRAFARAAKELGGSVRSQNADEGMILVKFESGRRQPRTAKPKARHEHSRQAIEAEMRRLNPDYKELDAPASRKLEISAKRNLSRTMGQAA
jgi:hypothetical protein